MQMCTIYTLFIPSEVTEARRLYEQHGQPSVDVTRRSIEEPAAKILNLLTERNEDS